MSITCYSRTQIINEDDETPPHWHESWTEVFVVFTSINWSLKVLEKAREISEAIGGKIIVVAVQAVPYQLPLNEPPIKMEFAIRRFEENVENFPYEIQIYTYLCRDLMEALKRILNPGCRVVVGVKERWWPTPNERLARKLRRAGYEVISIKSE
jgi:hypothetical protein